MMLCESSGMVGSIPMRLRHLPDTSKANWAGETSRYRAEEAGRDTLYELPYAEMCEASHSCYGTLEYALVGIDRSRSVPFGPMIPSTRPHVDVRRNGAVDSFRH